MNLPNSSNRSASIGVLALDPWLHKGGMEYNDESRGADEPEEGAQGRRPPKEGEANDEQADVQRLLGYDVVADLHWLRGCTDVG